MGENSMNRKATFSDLTIVVLLVAIAFGICMWSKTLVGFLDLIFSHQNLYY